MKSQVELLPLLREYRVLERKRSDEGVTPLEYQRWLDLKRRLSANLTEGPPTGDSERRAALRVPTRLKVEFPTPGGFDTARIRDLSQGGLFVATPFTAEIGTELELRVRIGSTGEVIELPAVVVTNNVANGFATADLGMGMRFRGLSVEQKARIHQLQMQALEELGRPACESDVDPEPDEAR